MTTLSSVWCTFFILKKGFDFNIFLFFAKKVFIAENRNLTHVEVPNLRRHEISVDLLQEEKLEEVSIKRNSPSQATIRYRPGTYLIFPLIYKVFCWTFVVVIWQASYLPLVMELDFNKRTVVLKVHPTVSEITAHATMPGRWEHSIAPHFWSKWMVREKWSPQWGVWTHNL